MPARETEAIILKTFPLGEADRLVSFVGRTPGRFRGVGWGCVRGFRGMRGGRCGGGSLGRVLRITVRGSRGFFVRNAGVREWSRCISKLACLRNDLRANGSIGLRLFQIQVRL